MNEITNHKLGDILIKRANIILNILILPFVRFKVRNWLNVNNKAPIKKNESTNT